MPWKLVLRHLSAHPIRSLLTFGSVTLAVFLLCVLQATVSGLTSTIEKAATNRLIVQSAVSLFVDLPLNYQQKIETVDGIDWVCKFQWFGGRYREETGFFAQFAIDPDTLAKTYPEMSITAGSYEAFERNRTGCILGRDLANRYGWKVGDSVPLIGTIFPRVDGTPWTYTVEAIYESSTPSLDMNTMWFHYEYLRQSLDSGAAAGPSGVGVFVLRTESGADPTRIMADVDALFENGPQRVQTTTEGEFNRQFITMLGSVPLLLSAIGGAVLFAVFFAVLNAMLMAARERVRELGILKALGFTGPVTAAMLIIESVLLCAGGGLFGLAIAKLTEPVIYAKLSQTIPGFEISPRTVVFGLVLTALLGLVAGLVPAWGAARMAPVTALRNEG
ncbi:MAG: FtsX-like permease family protein [Acidobacteriota bacterium]